MAILGNRFDYSSSVSQYGFRIDTIASSVGLNVRFQIASFMKRIPAKMIHAGQPPTRQTDTELCTKLNRLVQLAADDRSHMRLADADNAIITTTAFVLVHIPLLFKDMLNQPVSVELPMRQGKWCPLRPARQKPVRVLLYVVHPGSPVLYVHCLSSMRPNLVGVATLEIDSTSNALSTDCICNH